MLNHDQFVASLSSEQNSALIAFRDVLQAMYAQAAAETAEQHLQTVSELKANQQGAALRLADAETTIANQNAELRDRDAQIARLDGEINRAEVEIAKLHDQSLANERLITGLNAQCAEYLNQISELQTRLSESQSDVVSATAALANSDSMLGEKTNALENALARIHELENPPVIPTHISPATFRARFTNEQLLNIWDSSDPMAQLLVIKLCTTPYVDLASEEVIGGVHYLSALRLISEDDIGRILAPA